MPNTISLTSSNPYYYISVSENKRQFRTSTQRNTTGMNTPAKLNNPNLRGPLSTGVPNYLTKRKETTPLNHTPKQRNSMHHLRNRRHKPPRPCPCNRETNRPQNNKVHHQNLENNRICAYPDKNCATPNKSA